MTNVDATRGDPTAPDRRSQAAGEGAAARSLARSSELGTVIAYATARLAATVRTDSGRLLDDVPTLAWPRDRVTLEVGDRVVVDWDLGIPVIRGGFPAGVALNLEGGLAEPKDGASFREAGDVTPLIPGDWGRLGDRGHGVHVLRGGLTEIGGPSARVRTLENAGFVDVTARKVRVRTEWGESWTDTSDGKTTLYLRGGSDQVEQNGGGKERWTVGITAGAAANGFDLTVSDPDGRSAVRISCVDDGTLELRCGNYVLSTTGDSAVRISGDASEDVDGKVSRTSGGDAVLAAGGNLHLASAGEASFQADQALNIRGQSFNLQASEKALISAGNSTVTGVALELAVPHGDLLCRADRGDVTFKAVAGDGSFSAAKTLSLEGKNKTVLGGAQIEIGGALSALPMWDAFTKNFVAMMGALMGALQGGTSGGPTAQQITGLPAAQVVIQRFLSELSTGIYNSKKVTNG